MACAVVDLDGSLAFAGAVGHNSGLFLGLVSKGAARSHIMDIFVDRALSRDFASGAVWRIIKDLSMALEVGDGQDWRMKAVCCQGRRCTRRYSRPWRRADDDMCVQRLSRHRRAPERQLQLRQCRELSIKVVAKGWRVSTADPIVAVRGVHSLLAAMRVVACCMCCASERACWTPAVTCFR